MIDSDRRLSDLITERPPAKAGDPNLLGLVTAAQYNQLREELIATRHAADGLTVEPGNGSYVAVWVDRVVQVYRRDDARADREGEHANWLHVSGLGDRFDGSPRTWDALCACGPVAYVGVFVDRRGKEAA